MEMASPYGTLINGTARELHINILFDMVTRKGLKEAYFDHWQSGFIYSIYWHYYKQRKLLSSRQILFLDRLWDEFGFSYYNSGAFDGEIRKIKEISVDEMCTTGDIVEKAVKEQRPAFRIKKLGKCFIV